MRHLLTTALLLLSTVTVYAQDEKKDLPATLTRRQNREVYYEKVYPVPNTPKAELYQRARQWISAHAHTGDNNIVFDDKGNDYINTANSLVLDKVPGVTVSFKLSVAFKDDKVKVECPLFTYINISQGVVYQHELGTISFGSANKRIYRSFDDSFGQFLASFESAVNTPAKTSADW